MGLSGKKGREEKVEGGQCLPNMEEGRRRELNTRGKEERERVVQFKKRKVVACQRRIESRERNVKGKEKKRCVY